MKLLLVKPFSKMSYDYVGISVPEQFKKPAVMPPLSLMYIAALTPDYWEKQIIDDQINEVDFDQKFDLVAITSYTQLVSRAYYIADEFRNRGIKVIMGGIHPSALPQEALQHADSVVIGEAEPVWKQIILDFENNCLKREYKSNIFNDTSLIPSPDYSLVDKPKYLVENIVETSRGCPFHCEFCSVTNFFGGKYRLKSIEHVLSDIKSLDMSKLYFFCDDNIVGSPKRAAELFKAIKPLNIKWYGQATITIGLDTELLQHAKESGCEQLFLGIESIYEDNLVSSGKNIINHIYQYEQAFKNIKSAGIMTYAGFVFGFDSDDLYIFNKTLEFIKKNEIDIARFNLLTPYPGTPLFHRLKKENRLYHIDWSKYDTCNVVFEPKNMTSNELADGITWTSNYMSQLYIDRTESLMKALKPFNINKIVFSP